MYRRKAIRPGAFTPTLAALTFFAAVVVVFAAVLAVFATLAESELDEPDPQPLARATAQARPASRDVRVMLAITFSSYVAGTDTETVRPPSVPWMCSVVASGLSHTP